LSLIVAIVLGVYVLTVLAPYVIGLFNRSSLQNRLTDQKEEWLTRVIRVLRTPFGESHVDRLGMLYDEFTEYEMKFLQTFTILQLEKEIRAGATADELRRLTGRRWGQDVSITDYLSGTVDLTKFLQWIQDAQQLDLRFQHASWMTQLRLELGQMRGGFVVARTSERVESLARAWGEAMRDWKREVREETDRRVKSRVGAITLTSLVGPIVSSGVGQLAKTFWDVYAKDLAK
jgi:hypothetical protein